MSRGRVKIFTRFGAYDWLVGCLGCWVLVHAVHPTWGGVCRGFVMGLAVCEVFVKKCFFWLIFDYNLGYFIFCVSHLWISCFVFGLFWAFWA